MSSPTLQVALLLLGVLAMVPPSTQFNPYMLRCSKRDMRVEYRLSTWGFSGDWYVSHVTRGFYDIVELLKINTIKYNVQPVYPSRDNRGYWYREFFRVIDEMSIDDGTNNGHCLSRNEEMCEFSYGRCAGQYYPIWITPPISWWPRWFLYWTNWYVLATDYYTTAVVLVELNLDGYNSEIFDEIQIWTRDAGAQPRLSVVDEGVAGMCDCGFVDVDGYLYNELSSNTTKACSA